MNLDNELKNQLIKIIKEGRQIPASFKNVLFPPEQKPKEYELIYGIKEREEDILADTMAVPFQAVKRFGNVKKDTWHNKLIFGDNLQVLKYLKKLQEQGKMEKIKLIFIDPPFGTGDIYDAKGAPAYSAAIQGAEFLEFLRKRLILLRDILANDGSIFVRIDYHFGHYIKVLMDEIFDKNNFRNEFIVKRGKVQFGSANKYTVATDSIYWYTISNLYTFNKFKRERYEHEPKTTNMIMRGERNPRERIFYDERGNKHILLPPPNTHFKFVQFKIDEMIKKNLITLKKSRKGLNSGFMKLKKGKWEKTDLTPSYFLDMPKAVDTNWTDISGYSQQWNYPTENSEPLLERIITTASNPGDLVLDCFAGSGTTGAVAQKLGRRWIMADCGKLAIYTMIRRLHSLKEKISNKGKTLKQKSFVLYNAGLYKDHDTLLKMGNEQYKRFALECFQVEPKEIEINGLKMDGVLFNCPVRIFSQKGYLTEKYIDDLHNTVSKSLKTRMFIIAPASRVYFLQDYIEKNGIRYYILRIPYSVIDELHKKSFTRPIQPSSSLHINQNIEAIGFDFIHPPKVSTHYYKIKPKDKLSGYLKGGSHELVIEIKKFESIQRSKKPIEFKDPKDALSMVFIDRDYNGKFFNMTDYFFADQIKKQNYKIRLSSKTGNKIMIIYLDVLGNEKVEVKKLSDFKRRK